MGGKKVFSVILLIRSFKEFCNRDKFLIQGNMIFLALSEPPLGWFGRYFPRGPEQDLNL